MYWRSVRAEKSGVSVALYSMFEAAPNAWSIDAHCMSPQLSMETSFLALSWSS